MGFVRFLKDTVQLRALLDNVWSVILTIAAISFTLAVYLMITVGRPAAPDYWLDVNTSWGGIANNTVCEAPDFEQFVRQRANALGSYSYLAYAVICYACFISDFRQSRRYEARFANQPASIILRQRSWSVVMGTCLMFLGITSWLRYATMSKVALNLETVGLWTAALSLAICTVVRLLDPPNKSPTKVQKLRGTIITYVAFASLLAFGIAMIYQIEVEGKQGIPDLVFVGLGTLGLLPTLIHWRLHVMTIDSAEWLIVTAGVLFGFGYVAGYFDRQDILCDPESFFQLNAFWPFLASSAYFVGYLFLRSDMWRDGEGVDLDALFNHAESESGATSTVGGSRNNSVTGTTVIQRLHSRSDHDGASSTGISGVARSFASGMNSSVLLTPELGFSQAQIRAGEVACGVVVTGFVGAVVYYAFTS